MAIVFRRRRIHAAMAIDISPRVRAAMAIIEVAREPIR